MVEAMINFFYRFDITTPADSSEAIAFQTQLFALADKYDVIPLKNFIRQKYEQLTLAKEPSQIISAVKAVYFTEGTKELRNLVVKLG